MEKDRRYWKELSFYEAAIKDINVMLKSSRVTGRSCRLLNDYIERFFNEPMGTKIKVFDHYHGWNFYEDRIEGGDGFGEKNARLMMCRNIKRRLETEYPGVEYELTNDFYLIRKSPTYHEQLKEELEKRENELKDFLAQYESCESEP